MKTLWLIGGPMGVGKSSVGRALRDGLPRSIYLDGDWCWDASPFVVNAETKAMVMKNIRFLLRSFLECSEYENVVLAWVMHEQAIIAGLTEGLPDCRVIAVSLICSERELERRIRKDEAAGLRATLSVSTMDQPGLPASIAMTCDEAVAAAIGILQRQGGVNYFGKQRFGFHGGNVADGMAILAGKRAPHQKRLLLVSAVQSAIFNLMAAARFEKLGNAAIAGDVLQKINAGCFVCENPQIDTTRIAQREVAVTLPLFGKKVMPSGGDVCEFERQCVRAFFDEWATDGDGGRGIPLDPETLAKFSTGDRRQFVIFPSILNFIRIDASRIDVRFALPPGGYATVLLRQLCGTSFTR